MNIEDYLEYLVTNVELMPSDQGILVSISRQVGKDVGLTDRQHALLIEKIKNYQEHFETFTETDLLKTRLPLRQIDRTKSVTVIDNGNISGPHDYYKGKSKWIKVRFPFSKKLIISIEELAQKHKEYYYHKKGTHEHFFRLKENIIFEIVNCLINKNFDIDKDLLNLYEEIKLVIQQKEDYIPAFEKGKYKNLTSSALELIKYELGNLDNLDPVIVQDRRFRFGCLKTDITLKGNTLTERIANRNSTKIFIKKSQQSIDSVVGSLLDLKRFPVLVILNESNAVDELHEFYKAVCNFISPEEQIVLFREDSVDDYNVNNFISDHKLNNWLDKNIKVVYINNKKLPKLLLKDLWHPMSCFVFKSHIGNRHREYQNSFDLNIDYGDDITTYMHFMKQGIQEI